MKEFNIEQAFNKFVGDKLWKPHNRKATAYIHSSTETGSEVFIRFEQKAGEHILSMSLSDFLEENNLKETDFYD